jgi:hypothetical protein
MSENHAIVGFNSGILSPKIDTRFDIAKYARGLRILQNMIATKYGSADRRPGLVHIDESYNSASIARIISFIYSASVAYKIEMTDRAFRFYYGDTLLEDVFSNEVVLVTPYTEDELFQIQGHQIGDIMWLVHPNRRPKLLSRTDPYTFAIENVKNENGPFLIRNDLLDLTITNPTTMTPSKRKVGQNGTLVASAEVFQSGHKGALFKLVHPREDTIVKQEGDGTSDILKAKGTFSFVTRGTWTGTVEIQRRDNSSVWDTFRTYVSNNNRNIIESWKEDEDNIEYRIKTESGMSAKFRSDLTIKDPSQEGIVRITGVGTAFSATYKVITELASTDETQRWHEGAWSNARGWPSAVTFFEERAVYAGSTTSSVEESNQIKDYPSLRNLVGV